VLASKIHQFNKQLNPVASSSETPSSPNLKALLKEYEHMRWLPTSSITAKAAFLGYLETGSSFVTYLR
jgi:hypothetical protein